MQGFRHKAGQRENSRNSRKFFLPFFLSLLWTMIRSYSCHNPKEMHSDVQHESNPPKKIKKLSSSYWFVIVFFLFGLFFWLGLRAHLCRRLRKFKKKLPKDWKTPLIVMNCVRGRDWGRPRRGVLTSKWGFFVFVICHIPCWGDALGGGRGFKIWWWPPTEV